MNPVLLAQLIGLATQALQALPALKSEYDAIKAAGSATPAELADLKAKIEAMDAARQLSWSAADAALTAAENN